MNVDEAYEVLGVEPDADEKTIRRAYAKLAKNHRPDTHPEEFSRIRKAYDELLGVIKNNDYKDPDIPSSPDLSASSNQEHFPELRAVSYVMDERSYTGSEGASTDDEAQADVEAGATQQQSYRTNSEANPLQSIEDDLIAAIKAVKPGQLDSENQVVLLVDDYLSASNHQSRKLREYVERFLVGTCLGDYYLPHAVRERVAAFSGLSTVVSAENRLLPWEREFLARFDESEQVEELLAQAGSKRNRAEYALVHGVSWSKALMLRFDENKTDVVNRWMYYSDQAFGEDDGLVHSGFRAKWARLQQIEPLNSTLLAFFIALMVASGLALNALGVPLQHFFQLPVSSMLQIAAGLAVLSWANLILVQMARPVIRGFVGRVRDWLFSNVPLPLLVVETMSVVLLIWGWALDGVLPSLVSTTLVVGSGCVLILVGVFARQWSWVNEVSFSSLVIRLFMYFYWAVELLDDGVRVDAATSSLWLMVGLVVWVAPPRLFFEWVEKNKNKDSGDGNDEPEGLICLRQTQVTLSTQYPRWFMASVAIACLVGATGLLFVNAPSFVSPVLLGVLVTVLAIELAISGGIHVDAELRISRYGMAWLLSVCTLIGQRLVEQAYSDFIAQAALSVFLVWSATYWLSPRVRVKIKG